MRVPAFIACVVWLLFNLFLGFSNARPTTFDLTDRSTDAVELTSAFDIVAKSTLQSRHLGIADIPACGVRQSSCRSLFQPTDFVYRSNA